VQVIISFTLFFVCVPLVHFTNSEARMGRWRNIFFARWAGIIVTLIIGGLNGYLIISSIKVPAGCAGARCCMETWAPND
jgi:Mn2+/Fe2+ NRAMP family transporter